MAYDDRVRIRRPAIPALRGPLMALAVSAAIFCAAGSAAACSAFVLAAGDEVVCGKNLDWDPFPARVLVNPRGVARTILPWRGWWPEPSLRAADAWTSRFGSVTVTAYGQGFIAGGMNEAGLVVNQAAFVADYAPDDGRPGVSCQQWLQYQLDNFATVDQVVENLGHLRLDGEGWHFLVADATGDWAVIEYPDGAPRVLRRQGDRPGVLTNAGYYQALDSLPRDKAFGGEVDIAAGDDSFGRFARLAARIRDYDPQSDGPAAAHAFRMLDSVSGDDTQRSVVYDAVRRRVLWRTRDNFAPRSFDLDDLDFSPEAPVRALDIAVGGPGDVAGRLVDFDEHDRLVLTTSVLAVFASDEARTELRRRGLTLDEAASMIARAPRRKAILKRGEQ